MTELLEKAFAEAARLPAGDRDELAAWILEELASEQRWQNAFAATPDLLRELAEEARREHRAGRTKPLNPDRI